MRRKDREIKDREQIKGIIEENEVCFLGLCDENEPYVVPMNYGYKDNTIYLHSAIEGKKLNIIKNNPKVCLVFNSDFELYLEGKPEEWTTYYKSVIAYGKAEIITDAEEKQEAINIIIGKFTDRDHEFRSEILERFKIIRIPLTEITAKGNIKSD